MTYSKEMCTFGWSLIGLIYILSSDSPIVAWIGFITITLVLYFVLKKGYPQKWKGVLWA